MLLQNRSSRLDPIIEAITPPTDEKICKLKYFEHLCRQEFREAYCLEAAFRRKVLGRVFLANSSNISWLRDLWISITPEVLIGAANGNFAFVVPNFLSDTSVLLDRLTSNISSDALLQACQDNIDNFRAAICMQEAWPKEKATNWLPKHLQIETPQDQERVLPEFCAPEFTIAAHYAKGPHNNRTKVLSRNGNPVTVEIFALEHLAKDGYRGKHTENVFWWQLMALLYWDVIFAFRKTRPIWDRNDLPPEIFSPNLWKRFSPKLKERSKELLGLGNTGLEAIVRKVYEHEDVMSIRWFRDKTFNVGDFLLAVQALKSLSLVTMLDYLACNYSTLRKGLPDLFVARTNDAKFVEVKQRYEKISLEQRLWHAFLYENNMQIEICRVNATQ